MGRKTEKRIFQGIVIIIILILIYYPGYKRIQKVRRKNRQLIQELENLKKENAQLQKKLELLQTDVVYIEKRAREKLGIAGEGEIIYEFVPSKAGENLDSKD